MIIKKKTSLISVIIPNSKAIVSDKLDNVLEVIFDFINISSEVTIDLISDTFGFPKEVSILLLEKLVDLGLLEKAEIFFRILKNTDTGSIAKVRDEKIINLGLQIIIDPFFVIHHYVYSFNKEATILNGIDRQKILDRKQVSGLDGNIIDIGEEIFESSQDEFTLEYELNNSHLFLRNSFGKKKITIKDDDEEVLILLSSLRENSSTDNIKNLLEWKIKDNVENINLLIKKQDMDEENLFEIIPKIYFPNRDNTGEVEYTRLIKLIYNWLNGVDVNTFKIRDNIFIFKDWYISVDYIINPNDDINLIYFLFAIHCLRNKRNDEKLFNLLLNEENFLETLNDEFVDFTNKLSVKESINSKLDYDLLFQIFWESNTIGKLLACRMIENEVII